MDEIESLGRYLKEKRESKNISLREVAKNTRVREHVLKAIDEDRYDLLPSPTYLKGFLLSYAKYISLEPEEVLRRYEKILKGEPVPCQESLPQKKIVEIKFHSVLDVKQIKKVTGNPRNFRNCDECYNFKNRSGIEK